MTSTNIDSESGIHAKQITNITDVHILQSNDPMLWNYFKKCDDDSNLFKCLLCSTELYNKQQATQAVLWNHLKIKHLIAKKKPNYNNNNVDHNLTRNGVDYRKTRVITERQSMDDINNKHIISNVSNNDSTIMTKAQYHNQKPMLTDSKYSKNQTRTPNSPSTSVSLRRNLDLIDYNELSLTSMKPSPSASVSKTLISRLNQLSSPVTRKLKFWNKKSFQVNQYDPSFKVIYLGNLGIQIWSKDESCLEKPLNTLWNNYLVNMKTEIVMRLTICNSGLKAITRQHGLTQYWSNRLVYCCSHKNYPKIFSWIYRHEGKKMRQELRCHAVFCSSPEKVSKMVTLLNQRLACALQEFKREKRSRGSNATTNNNMQQPLPRTIPLRRQILAKGSANFRPPLERSKSAPKLTSIREEDYESTEDSQDEYEFNQSFDNDRIEYDTETDSDGDLNKGSCHIEAAMLKADSNSWSTTIQELTSNSSSVCVTGDIPSYDKQSQMSNRDNLDNVIIVPDCNEVSSSGLNTANVILLNDDQQRIDLHPELANFEQSDGPIFNTNHCQYDYNEGISNTSANITASEQKSSSSEKNNEERESDLITHINDLIIDDNENKPIHMSLKI